MNVREKGPRNRCHVGYSVDIWPIDISQAQVS